MPKGEIVGIKLFAISDNTQDIVQTENQRHSSNQASKTQFKPSIEDIVQTEHKRLSVNRVKMHLVLTE